LVYECELTLSVLTINACTLYKILTAATRADIDVVRLTIPKERVPTFSYQYI